MGRGGPIYLSYTALVLLSTASSAAANLWSVSIDESPAPSPEDGPPFSAHASRNLALLPYQIVGIVGAYLASIAIVLSLLLTVGRKLRKRAKVMAQQPKEMIKPLSKTFDRSPISPSSSRTWYSRRLKEKKSATSSIRSGTTSNQMSPGMDSVVSFDTNVIEADRMRRQEEMERLYSAVMLQQDAANQPKTPTATTTEMPPEYSRKNPPRLVTDAPSLQHLQAGQGYAYEPTTPKSPVRAIYPPGSSIPPGPSSPTSPINAEYPSFQNHPSYSDLKLRNDKRTSSYGSSNRNNSASPAPSNSKFRKSLRNIKISNPIIRNDDNSDGARTPLSPRYYTDPGIPPEPPTARTVDTANSMQFPPTPNFSRPRDYDEEYDEDRIEGVDEVRDLPQANPQRLSAHMYTNPAQLATNASRTGGTVGSLPLREMNRQYAAQVSHAAQQQQQAQQQATYFPLSPTHWNPAPNTGTSTAFPYATSAGPVKTTFLDVRNNRLGGGARTAGLATPYSPYMPFTPLTPVTPHLTSRAERKQRKKEERRERGVPTEGDLVEEEGEMWGDAY